MERGDAARVCDDDEAQHTESNAQEVGGPKMEKSLQQVGTDSPTAARTVGFNFQLETNESIGTRIQLEWKGWALLDS